MEGGTGAMKEHAQNTEQSEQFVVDCTEDNEEISEEINEKSSNNRNE